MDLRIGPIDTLLLAIFLIASIVFGLWMGRRSSGLQAYLLGNRDLPWWALLGSIVATETSTVTFLSVPGTLSAEGGNLSFLQLVFGFVIGRSLVAWLLMPRFFAGRYYTAYAVLHQRFGWLTSRFASGLFIVTRTLADGLRLYLTAIVLEKAIGIGLELSILVIAAATLVYTYFGGMKSVVWNDCVQLLIYLSGALIAGGMLIDQLGWDSLREYAISQRKLTIIVPEFSLTQPYTLLSGLVGGVFLTMATHGADQLMVQRYLCARNQRGARLALFWSGPIIFLQFTLFLLVGVGLACFYRQGTPAARPFAKPDEIFATFIVEELPTGLTGVVMAAVFAAAMSTLSSSLNSSATTVVNDFLRRESQSIDDETASAEHSSDRRWTRWSRGLTLLFGMLQAIVAVSADRLIGVIGESAGSSVISAVLSIAGLVTGITLGAFALAFLRHRVPDVIAFLSMSLGLAAVVTLFFATSLAWTWYAFVGATLTFAAGAIMNSLRSSSNPMSVSDSPP